MTGAPHQTVINSTSLLRSCPCSQSQLESDVFQHWLVRAGESHLRMHRKGWEHAFIAQALFERGMLKEGRRGLGFAVGQEGLPALFASMGCTVVGSDLEANEAATEGWVDSGQHASSLEVLNKNGVCPPGEFRERVQFRFVDMRAIPGDLRGFDFVWSSCALDHLGSLRRGTNFILDSLDCLKPGGIAVHTTEYNLSSNAFTAPFGPTVIFRRRDFESLGRRLLDGGHHIDFDFTLGNGWAETMIDKPPYRTDIHFRLRFKYLLFTFVTTSFGLIIRKSNEALE